MLIRLPLILKQQVLLRDEARAKLGEVNDREKEQLKLERSIAEIHDLIVDVAVIIEQQGRNYKIN